MNFKPNDEISLRHLFSTDFAKEVLKLSYIGPVLNSTETIETSPDALILDMRKSPFQTLRCEFKYSPSSKNDFVHNGNFNIAIIWSLQQGNSRNNLSIDLLKQNGCTEIIVLSEDFKAFRDLPEYSIKSLSHLNQKMNNKVVQIALKQDFAKVCILYIASKIHPEKFKMDKMVEYLLERFPEIKNMKEQGRANVVSAFIQTKPPLLSHMHGNFYRWSNEFDSKIAACELSELIISRFGEKTPLEDDIKKIIQQ